MSENEKSGHGIWLSRAALGFVAMAAMMGWGASFVGLHAYGQGQMVGFSYWTAWLIPATFDGAAFGATLITYRASIFGRSAMRGRLLMWVFTAISSWINWIHQTSPEARIVAAGLPVAAVAVFDVVLAEMRADYEERHGKRRLRLRPGLLMLRWLVDRPGTASAFRRQVTDIPVAEIAGLRTNPDINEQSPQLEQPTTASTAPTAPEPEPQPVEPTPEVQPTPEPQPAAGPQPTAPTAIEPPPEQTLTLPPVPSEGMSDEDKRTFARRDYRLSLENGDPITGAQLGQRYGFSERWGRRQIAAVRVEMEEYEEDPDLVSVN